MKIIKCGNCKNFKPHNDHGRGSGECSEKVQPFGAIWWSETTHLCDKYKEIVVDSSPLEC